MRRLGSIFAVSFGSFLLGAPALSQGMRSFSGFTADPRAQVVLPACPTSTSQVVSGSFEPSEANYPTATSSRGSFFVDASARLGNFDKQSYVDLLQSLHARKQKTQYPDVTNQLKCQNYFLKRSNLEGCVDLGLQLPSQSSIAQYPSIKKVFQCSPGSSIIVLQVSSGGADGFFILDPFNRLRIKAVDARFANPDYFAAATGEKHVYSGNLLITPPGQALPLGHKSYDALFRYPMGTQFTMGDDYTYLFQGSPFWASIFTKDLLAATKGSVAAGSVPIEKQIGLELKMCSPACLRAIKQDYEAKGWFFSPDDFWSNLDKELVSYPNGVPIVTAVTPGSEAYKEGIRENVFILKIGSFVFPSGVPRAVSIESIRENIYNVKNYLEVRVMALVDGPKGKVVFDKQMGWLRSKYR